jgi:hypothetical protein
MVAFHKISWQDAQSCMKALFRWIEAVQAIFTGSQLHLGFVDGTLEGSELSGILHRNGWLSGSLRPAVTFRQVCSLHHDHPREQWVEAQE